MKTFQVCSVATEDGILAPSSGRWSNSAMGSPTECWMLNTSEGVGCTHKDKDGTRCPNGVGESLSSLASVLEAGSLPPRFYLSPKACQGILRRAERRGKALPPMLKAALDQAAGAGGMGGGISQTLDAVLAKGQMMPEKNRFPAVLQPVVIDRAAFNQGANAQYDPHIGHADVMDPLVARGPHAVGVRDAGVPFRKSKRAQSETDDESWVEAEGSNTLNNFDLGDTRTTHPVVEPHIVQASELRLRGQITEQKSCPTLLAQTKSGDNDPLAVHAITFQPGNLRREAGADPSTTTTTTLKASAGDQMPHVATPMAVRRLTPTECMRLQGFPDDWARIPWKGKPADQCPDGPQYKAAGNSMAVPVMRHIGTRIAMVEAGQL